MKVLSLLVLLIFSLLSNGSSIDSEDDLPPFLRGIEWRNVEKELRKDMRLSSSLLPLSYEINLNVSVRGYEDAERSTFDGSVLITLNISSPIKEIELHSVGLNIKKAQLMTSILGASPTEIEKISYNRERETVVLTLSEDLQPTMNAQLKIDYNGTAVMRGFGLYESWTKRANNSQSLLPTISLVTNCSPTGARRWFPGFDEPDKKAKFRLRLQYPNELTAFSNTEGVTKALDNGRSETSFKETAILPTYVVAFALTEQPFMELEHDGQIFRVIGGNENIVERVTSAHDCVKKQRAFTNVSFIPEKTDWLIVHDFPFSAMENPGLITMQSSIEKSAIIHELAHMYFGNLVTHQSWEQVWLKEGFATLLSGDFKSSPTFISLFEPALHHEFSYSRTQFIMGHFFMYGHIHYDKAAQFLSLIRRYLGEKSFDRAINQYLIDNSFGNGDTKMMINYLSTENSEARTIMTDWLYQPGLALLTVEEKGDRVEIQQRRLLDIDFDEKLRDLKTRWTIPLYYTINGAEHMQIMPREVEKFTINVPPNSNFSIDETYSLLYKLNYTNRNIEETPSNLTSLLNINWKLVLETSCNVTASNTSSEELWEMYLIQGNANYLLCDNALSSREDAMMFLHKLLVSNELPVRNRDLFTIVKGLNTMHSGIFLDFLVQEHSNIDSLNMGVCKAIVTAVEEEGGANKLHEIVRANPSFAANFYHVFTKIFEKDFIQRNRHTEL